MSVVRKEKKLSRENEKKRKGQPMNFVQFYTLELINLEKRFYTTSNILGFLCCLVKYSLKFSCIIIHFVS